MSIAAQAEKAAAFRRMHDRSGILVLPNAWDAASARVFEAAGFPAVATTSAGVAWALGYADGERVPREVIDAVRRIARSVAVPVTADMEAGFGATPDDVAETARLVLAAGAVGVNLEDSHKFSEQSLVDVESHVAKIGAARAAAESMGVPLVINARTDVYLEGIGAPKERFAHTVRRANAYRAAGADCVFVPAVTDADTIGKLVDALEGPLNVLARVGCPSVAELKTLGVARVSVGSGPMTATLTLLRNIAREMHDSGTFSTFTRDVLPYAEWNRLMAGSQA